MRGVKNIRVGIVVILLLWILAVVLQIDSHVGIGSLVIVLALAGVYHWLGKIIEKG